jgi:hypothetical protein
MDERELRIRRHYPLFVTAQVVPAALFTAWALDARISGTNVGLPGVWLLICVPVLIIGYRQARAKRNRPELWAILAMAANAPSAIWLGWIVVDTQDPNNSALTFGSFLGTTALAILIPSSLAWIAARRARRAPTTPEA